MLMRKRNNTSSIFDILFYFVLMLGYLVGCWMNEVMVQIVFTLVFTFKIMKLITSKHIATHSCQTSKSKKDPEAEQVKEWKSQ